MIPDLERLISLQHLESAIADARSKIASHPDRLAAADARLAEAREAVDAIKRRLKDNQEARRELEKNAAVYQGRLTKFKDQLSEVKTNREYQAMQHEIATAQTELGAAEEKVLERMLDADTIADELKRAEATLAKSQKEIEAEKKALTDDLAVTERELATGQAARADLVRQSGPQLIDLFQQLAKARKGVAISLVTHDGLCSVCHVRLRLPVFQKVRHNDSIVQCEVCQRILYYVPPPRPAEAAATS